MNERLRDGALRFAAPRCSMVLARLGPARLHLQIAGDDHGELGDAVLAELDREGERFRQPLTLHVDSRRATPPADAVRDTWSTWFARRRDRLARVHMLVPGAVLDLTARVVRQLAGIEDMLDVTADAQAFESAVGPHGARLGADRTAEATVTVQRVSLADGVMLSDGVCRYEYHRLSPAVLRLDIHGRDAGSLGALPLDELMAHLREQARNGALFVDASGAGSVDERVREEWIAWIRAHRDDFAALSILAGSPLMRLTFSLAREAAGVGQRLRVYDDSAAFADAVVAATGRGR